MGEGGGREKGWRGGGSGVVGGDRPPLPQTRRHGQMVSLGGAE